MNEPMHAEVVIDLYEIRSIEGKLLTLVESIGLPQKQEEAIKSLVRQIIWNEVEKPFRAYIWEHEYGQLHDFIQSLEKSRTQGSESLPPNMPARKKSK